MDETRRFLRYVIPGLVFFIEVLVYLSISTYNHKNEFLDKLIYWLSNKDLTTAIGVSVTAFLTSGALGYIFSNVYHAISNVSGGCVDHRSVLMRARDNKWIRIFPEGTLDKRIAWCVVTALWKSRLKTSLRIEGADHRMDSLTDILHGLGASVVASVCAIPVWIFMHKKLLCSYPWQNYSCAEPSVFVISFLVVIVNIVNYFYTAKNAEGIVFTILSEELRRGWPLEVDVCNEKDCCSREKVS